VIAKPSSYRTEIDGLRAIAVIAVIVNHINKSFIQEASWVLTFSLLSQAM